jgi:two-component system, chemotaxis family, CheB/CheR fusion protein
MKLPESDPAFESLLQYLKRERAFDFTGYKRTSLMRRIRKRMQLVRVDSFDAYSEYLEAEPGEFIHLFNTILINVTSFFRDASAWESLAQEILPGVLREKEAHDPIRVWSAGCASGEEAYSVAVLLAEALGTEQFRERVKIYATDVDEEALDAARRGAYQSQELQGLPEPFLCRYFEPNGGRQVFNKDLRRSLIFGRHDLIRDAPISRIDLLVCRNVLMYFDSSTQAHIMKRFRFALVPHGYLFLGKAETLATLSESFAPIDPKSRIFRKLPSGSVREHRPLRTQEIKEEAMDHLTSRNRLKEAAFDASPVAYVVVEAGGSVALANREARRMFNLTARDIGRPLQDLEFSYRPVELRSLIDQVKAEGRPAHLHDVPWGNSPGSAIWLEVHVHPLTGEDGSALGVGIAFEEISHYRQLKAELTRANEDLEAASEELQSANEELETTNEELQSTIEELETTNEELQSTNEELETMNEELQSTNEELEAINEELRRRGAELNLANAYLEAILSSLRGGVAVVDRDLHVHIWNHRAEDLWGLRSDEVVGKHLLNLDIGLPVEQLQKPLRACLGGQSGHVEAILDATNRRGRAMRCRITVTPLAGTASEVQGAILLMEEEEGEPQKRKPVA